LYPPINTTSHARLISGFLGSARPATTDGKAALVTAGCSPLGAPVVCWPARARTPQPMTPFEEERDDYLLIPRD
jgi:hypothetical protein